MSAKGKILIVDDDPNLSNLLKDALKFEGYDVFRSLGPDEGIKSAKILKPQLVILDVMMPGKNGFEVAKILKEDPLTSDIPILMLTAKAMEEDKVAGALAGASRYITKPFELRQLLDEVEALITWESPRE